MTAHLDRHGYLGPNHGVDTADLIAYFPRDLEEEGKYIFFATRNGTVKKCELKDFSRVRASGINGINIAEGNELVAVSLTIGLVAALAATRLLRSLLYEIGIWDPLTFGAIGLLLSFVSIFAAWFPARRAAHVDPVIALRSE